MDKSVITLESVVSSVPNVLSSDIDGETMIMSIENGNYYGLDDIASVIWKMMASPVRIAEIVEELLPRFEVEREKCERDVLHLIAGLAQQSIVRVDGDAAHA